MAKVEAVTTVEDAAMRGLAEEVYNKISRFAAYGFNKSHAVEYALISYQTMWLKVRHPVEFWCGTLSMLKDERRDAALMDMRRLGIRLLPPDVNLSGVHFTALNDTTVLAPFSAVKGCSEKGAEEIVRARGGTPFASAADLEARCTRRIVTSKVRDVLDRVGAFSRVEPGQLPADHPDRRRDQVELMPGLISDAVVIDRPLDLGPGKLDALSGVVEAWRACDRCELAGLCHPRPMLRGAARVMVVVDGPNFKEERADEMGHGSAWDAVVQALGAAGMEPEEVYLTSLVKSVKPEKGKGWSTATLAACPHWLEEEIRLLRPPAVLILGSEAFRHFLKGQKGGINDHAGRVVYDKERDLNLVVGINPGAIYYDASKQDKLNEIVARLPDLLPLP